MRLDNSPELLWLPRKVPMRVPENPALLLFGRGSRFGEALARHAGFVAALSPVADARSASGG